MMTGLRRSGAGLLLLAAVFLALFMAKGSLSSAPPIDPAGEFDVSRAVARLARILGDERPHPVDSDANDAVRERLISEIRAIGFDPEVRDGFSCRSVQRRNAVSCARVRNVLFRAGPENGRAILVAAHYDSVPAGPGAADDGAGMGAALEIAEILKTRRPVHPVIFLMTDGEEAGLLGARSFVRSDPAAKELAAVINMEARGVSGPAILFETSSPNGRDIEAYLRRTKRPVGNSLATDIYKMLPNDTDMSEFLGLPVDAANFAFTDRLPLYHTPGDNLSNLDRRSFAHLGRSALASIDGFLRNFDEIGGKREERVVFADVLSRFMLVTPQLAGLAMIIAGLAASVTAFFRITGGRPVRAAMTPLIAMAGAGAAAFALTQLVALVRSENSFWFAAPHWTRAIIYLAAVCASIAAFVLAADADRRRVLAASWIWFSAMGVVLYAAAPGAAMLFGAPAGLFACAAFASAGATRLLAPLSLIGVVAAFALWLPTLHYAEIGLGLGAAWPFAILGALLFMLAAPIVAPPAAPRLSNSLAPAALLVAAVALAITAPAYSPSAPRPLNIQHFVDGASAESFLALSAAGEKIPESMRAVSDFAERDIPGLDRRYLTAPAAAHDGAAVGVEVSSVEDGAQGRKISLKLRSNGADEIILIAPQEAKLTQAEAGGDSFDFTSGGPAYLRCSGRSCSEFEVGVTVGADPAEYVALAVRYGLGPEGEALKAARPDWATPIQNGDVRITLSRTTL